MSLFIDMLQRAETTFRGLADSAEDKFDATRKDVTENFANEIRELLNSPEADEWRELHASLQSLHRKMDVTMDQLAQLSDVIDRVAKDITTAVDDIKNHPAAPDLSGPIAKLTAAADALEAVEVPVTPAPAPAPAPEPVPAPVPDPTQVPTPTPGA